jgi:hypothetical protein
MTGKPKRPSKAAIEARPTLISDDIFAGRSFWQYTSDIQKLPEGDNRCRVTHSEKFYVVQLMGSWVHVSESAERSIEYRNRLKWVRFENKKYELRNANKFKSFVGRFVQGGCYAYVGGKEVHSEKAINRLIEQPFIYISSSEALRIFNDLRKRNAIK